LPEIRGGQHFLEDVEKVGRLVQGGLAPEEQPGRQGVAVAVG